jgi:hypothetical protein
LSQTPKDVAQFLSGQTAQPFWRTDGGAGGSV